VVLYAIGAPGRIRTSGPQIRSLVRSITKTDRDGARLQDPGGSRGTAHSCGRGCAFWWSLALPIPGGKDAVSRALESLFPHRAFSKIKKSPAAQGFLDF
jgi:hypothetical protein